MRSRWSTARITITLGCVLAIYVALSGFAVNGARAQTWQPPDPTDEKDDWIKMNSGEWLRGTLEVLRDTYVEFDSKELDLLKLDWGDIAELRSPRRLSYRFEDIGVFEGPAVMRDGKVAISTESGDREFPREKLIYVVAEGQGEFSLWSAKASLGVVTRAGNTEQTDFNTNVNIRRQTTATRLDFRYLGNIGEVEEQQTINNHNATAYFDLLVAAGFYVTPVNYNYFRDPFQNISYRNTLSAGVGYVIKRGGKFEWTVGLGGGYQGTSFVSVQAGEDDTQRNGSVIPSTEFEWDITKDVEFDFNYNMQIGVPETKNSFQHLGAVFSIDILGDFMDLDFSFYWDRNQNPQANAEGDVPKKDDFRTVIGFGVDI